VYLARLYRLRELHINPADRGMLVSPIEHTVRDKRPALLHQMQSDRVIETRQEKQWSPRGVDACDLSLTTTWLYLGSQWSRGGD
jgi:hypothetical protein